MKYKALLFLSILIILCNLNIIPAIAQSLSRKELYPMTSNIDSLEVVLSKTKSSQQKMYQIYLIESNTNRLNPSRFGKHFEEFRKLAEELKSNEGLAIYHRWKSIKYRKTGEFESSMKEIQESIAICQKYKDSLNWTKGLTVLGLLHNSGLLKGSVNNVEEAMQLGKQAEQLAHKINAHFEEYQAIILQAMALKTQKRYSESERLLKKATHIIKPLKGSEYFEIGDIINLSGTYIFQGKYAASYESLREILPKAKLKQDANMPILFFNLAYCCRELGKYQEAEKYLNEGLEITHKHGAKPLILDYYNSYKLLYQANHQYNKALLFADKYQSLKDSLFTAEKTKQLQEIEIKYETAKKEQQNKLLKKEKSFAESRNQLYLILIFLTILALGITVFLSISIKNKNHELSQLVKTREQFIRIMAHDLRRPLHAFMGMSEVMGKLLKKGDESSVIKIANSIDESGIKIQQMLDNTLYWALAQNEKVMCESQYFLLKPHIQAIMAVYDAIFTIKHLDTEIVCNDTLDVFTDPNALDLIIRNLLDNATKNTAKGGKIEINAKEEEDGIVVQIRNEGTIISTDKLTIIRDVLANPQMAQPKENGLGLGLIIVGTFAKQNSIAISVESSQKGGTIFALHLPLSKSTLEN